MRPPSIPIFIAVTSTSFLTAANAQSCAAGSGTGTAQEIKGNWYCSSVKAITYDNFPGYGYYNKVTNMDASSGECSSNKYAYSGSLSPLNEELSLHVRGPVLLKQVAIYKPIITTSTSNKFKRSDHNHAHGHARHGQHGHHWMHENRELFHQETEPNFEFKLKERAIGDLVTAIIDGKAVSWTNEYAEPGATTAVAGAADLNDSAPEKVEASTAMEAPVPSTASNIVNKASSSNQGPSSTGNGPSVESGSWARQAYFNAEDSTVEGITFLNHFGGMDGIPGTAAGGSAFGASLSYASSDGQSGTAFPQVLSNALIEDDIEVVIMSNKSCDDGGCGYTRPGGVAYHGFSGDRKLFILEFSMPFSGKTSFNSDMPAIWLHNAQIPLTSQYGTNPECSCWTSGCGEFDLFEILDPGNFRCKSTLHMAPAGGSSDWFMRPWNETITALVAFAGDNEKATIRVLDGGVAFDDTLNATVMDDWLSGETSVFMLSP